MAIGLFLMLYLCYNPSRFKVRDVVILLLFIFAIWFIGESRSVGVFGYLAGDFTDFVLEPEYDNYNLPRWCVEYLCRNHGCDRFY